ncbi:MAG: phosphorylcholine transferase LicD [Prevotella sp.]
MARKEYRYTEEELRQLHGVLYEILEEIMRVCDKCGIRYFIIGGTAIGAHFWQRILPWDDDIDIGMTRDNYNRFLEVAPRELKPGYFLQWVETDPHVPFFFAKVRKNHTLFAESLFRHIDMHQGFYVDVFAFDHIPQSRWLERLQWSALNFLNGCFISREIWQYRHCGKCEVEEPRERGFLPCLLTRLVNLVLTKRALYRLLIGVQTAFNGNRSPYCKNIITPNERVLIEDVEQPQTVTLGPLQVSAPRDLEAYLHNHYPVLVKDIPEEQRVNHRPDVLCFDTRNGKGCNVQA